MVAKLRADSHIPVHEVDRRIRTALMAAAKGAGPKAAVLMTHALANGPSKEGLPEAVRYFGSEQKLQQVIKLMDPMMFALNGGMPGFSEWLDRTGFGNDCTMIRALLAWVESDPELENVARTVLHEKKKLN
jgi:hypothetical protein